MSFLDFKESNAVYDCILAITPGGCAGRIVNAHYDLWGTLGGFVVGLVVAVVFWFLLFRATKRLVQTTMADERNSFGRNTRIAMKRSRSIRRKVLILARRPRPQQPRS